MTTLEEVFIASNHEAGNPNGGADDLQDNRITIKDGESSRSSINGKPVENNLAD